MSELVILDLGYGNTMSVSIAFERRGAVPLLSADPSVVEQADRLVLPGVGAAGEAMRRLRAAGLFELLRRRTKPMLGICLGMQLLFDRSDEDGGIDLLGRFPGTVEAIDPQPGFPVPHMGWAKVEPVDLNVSIGADDYVYFAHSFACPDSSATVARARYGAAIITAACREGPLWGAQFHPERSSHAGARFLETFLRS